MVANAHQDQEADGRKISDSAYLTGLMGVIAVLVAIPILKIALQNDIRFVELCMGKASRQEPITPYLIIILVIWSLCSLFVILISLKTRNNLKKLQHQHLENLPANNALTYLDTQILCFIILLQALTIICTNVLFVVNIIPLKVTLFVTNFVHLCTSNIVISFIFPIYITLKTRRYLPRLWDDEAPLIIQNNDFYAVRLEQISPQQEMAESCV